MARLQGTWCGRVSAPCRARPPRARRKKNATVPPAPTRSRHGGARHALDAEPPPQAETAQVAARRRHRRVVSLGTSQYTPSVDLIGLPAAQETYEHLANTTLRDIRHERVQHTAQQKQPTASHTQQSRQEAHLGTPLTHCGARQTATTPTAINDRHATRSRTPQLFQEAHLGTPLNNCSTRLSQKHHAKKQCGQGPNRRPLDSCCAGRARNKLKKDQRLQGNNMSRTATIVSRGPPRNALDQLQRATCAAPQATTQRTAPNPAPREAIASRGPTRNTLGQLQRAAVGRKTLRQGHQNNTVPSSKSAPERSFVNKSMRATS